MKFTTCRLYLYGHRDTKSKCDRKTVGVKTRPVSHADRQGGRNKTLLEQGHLSISYLDQILEVWPNVVFLGLTQTSPRLRSVAAVPCWTTYLPTIRNMYNTCTGYLVSTDRYSVLRYLVLIITKFSTFMYLVSEIYLIRKNDIKCALAATLR